MLRAVAVRLDRDHAANGFTVAYEQDELQFPVWVLIVLTSLLFYASLSQDSVVLTLLALFPGSFAFHSFPLLETGKARVAATHDFLFIDGLGRIGWRFVGNIGIAEVIVRGNVYKEADIALLAPLAAVLSEDARDMPLHRRLMRKPYYLKSDQTIRLPLDVLDHSPDETIASLLRIWTHNRARPQLGSAR